MDDAPPTEESPATDPWHRIWERKGSEAHAVEGTRDEILTALLKLGGYDSNTATLSLEDFRAQIAYLAGVLGIRRDDSVYEVGCGAGAVLFELQRSCARIGGIDYAASLLRTALRVLRSSDLCHDDASQLPTTPAYDLVLSVGAFLYFPSGRHAEAVLARMVQKARRGVAVIDVNDADKEDDARAARRAANAGAPWATTAPEQLFLPRNFFAEFARQRGIRCRFDDCVVTRSINSRYRFNVFLFHEGGR
jgi:SAM-dependent methyltransferase